MLRLGIFTLLLSSSIASADLVVFSLADTDDAVFEHDSNGTNSPSPIPSAGSMYLGNGTFSWGTLATDTSPNTAVFSGGSFTSSDWGGLGTFTSVAIDVSSALTATIAAQYDGLFNSDTEFSEFFYILDGGTPVAFGQGVEDANVSNVGVELSSLDVSAASELVVGFTFNHNGSSDFFNVDSLSVSIAAIPEPTAALVGMMVTSMLGLTVARRPQVHG